MVGFKRSYVSGGNQNECLRDGSWASGPTEKTLQGDRLREWEYKKREYGKNQKIPNEDAMSGMTNEWMRPSLRPDILRITSYLSAVLAVIPFS